MTRSTTSISNCFLTLEWSPAGLTLLAPQTGKIIFQNANARVHLHNGGLQSLFGSFELAIEDVGSAVAFRSITDGIEMELRCFIEGYIFRVSLRVTNLGTEPVQLDDVQILVFDRQEGAVSHLLSDPCDIFSLGASTGETEQVWSKAPGNKKVFALRVSHSEPAYASDNLLAAQPVDGGSLTPHVTFSFDRIAEVASGVSIDIARGISAARAAFRGATLPAGCSRLLPSLYVDGLSPIHKSLADAADRVAAIYRPPLADIGPSGWCSWYYYYAHVTEADILENLDFLSRNRDRFPYSYIQIDDGYQLHWGDWLLPGRKFPHDMAWLAQRIKSAGFKPGIWVAPLIATAPSNLFREHPEWALRDFETGKEQTLQGWSPPEENPWVILDGTHPEFREYLKRVFHVMAHEWGYDYFKLDATAFGAYAGLRHDPTRTGIEGVRMALEAIREAVGPDKYILGCGLPFGAAVGLVNGERVSDDVSTAFRAGQSACPIEVSMPQSIHRSFIHGKWWHNDPDCVLVRSLGTPHEPSLSKAGMTLNEAQFFTTVVGLTQGIQMVGEKMMAIEEERLRLLDIIQPPLDAPAMPMDLFASQPSRLLLPTSHGILVGLLNWQHSELEMTVHWSELGLPSDAQLHIYELWTQTCLGIGQQSQRSITLPPHSARVLFFRHASPHPSFLGFDSHISCGSTLLHCERWNPATKRLAFDFTANRDGIAKFYVPPQLYPRYSELIPRVLSSWDLPLSKGTHSLELEFAQSSGDSKASAGNPQHHS